MFDTPDIEYIERVLTHSPTTTLLSLSVLAARDPGVALCHTDGIVFPPVFVFIHKSSRYQDECVS